MQNHNEIEVDGGSDKAADRGRQSSVLLADYKRLLFASSREEVLPTGDGMFCGMKIRVLTLPLPPGVIGMIGDKNNPEKAIFLSANELDQALPPEQSQD